MYQLTVIECNARSYPELSSKIARANHQAMSSRTGTLQQLTKYLDMELSDCLPFSQCNAVGLNKLFLPALHALSALVSSSAVEGIFQPWRPKNCVLNPHAGAIAWMGDADNCS